MKKTPQRIGINNSFLIIMDNTAIIAPIDKLPVSPINTCAGYELYQINPIQAPTKAKQKITISPIFGI